MVDEAYIDFGGETAASLVARYPNLLVIQTLSKSRSLAGMRVGFALGQRHLIDALERVKDSFNSYPLDRLAQVAATAAIEDAEWFETCRHKIIATRDRVSGELQAMGFDVLPSQANFIFAKHPALAGAEVYSALRAEGVLVRHWNKPRINDYLRISIGTDAECDRLLDVLKTLPAAG